MWYYTSDLHLDHKNVIKYCGRPFSDVTEMNAALIANWNARVRDGDTVYILGDFCMSGAANTANFARQLNGRKVLVPGNHDTFAFNPKFDPSVFDEIIDRAMCTVSDPFIERKIVLCHFPLAAWRRKENGALHFYGHVHNSTDELYPYMQEIENSFNVGVDVQEFFPKTAAEIVASGRK